MTSSETSPFDLTGRRILISGAAGGIGSATARLCVRQGARLVPVDLVSADIIRERVGPEVAMAAEFISLDTGSRADVTRLATAIEPVYGLIDTAAIASHRHRVGQRMASRFIARGATADPGAGEPGLRRS